MQEPFSNPIAPPDKELSRKTGQLSNDDFRVLLMTPRAAAVDEAKPTSKTSSATKSTKPSKDNIKKPRRSVNSEWLAELRKEEDERIAEWSKNYRDRAKERRDGMSGSTSGGTQTVEDVLSATSGYRAVAPNADSARVAEQRKQAIANSKYLGGDMEHTHLVKGLDFALLQKARSEMVAKEEEIKKIERRKEREKEKKEVTEDTTNVIRSKLAKNIYHTLFEAKPPERNDFFLQGRMAYVFELDDEYAESDIPTTLIRSKADCPTNEYQTTLSTNDIVINKLTQILSYLRQGTKDSKKTKRKDKGAVETAVPPAQQLLKKPKVEESIFPDVGEYDFSSGGGHDTTSSGVKSRQYFDDVGDERMDVETKRDIHKAAKEFVKAVGKKYSAGKVIESDSNPEGPLPTGWSAGEIDRSTSSHTKATDGQIAVSTGGVKQKVDNAGFGGFDEDHYAECYPGGMEEMDATVNSDDETDFTKMDMGNRKGPVKRWDFDTDEDYGNYQSSREALPKAAFQYGVKMNDGRKTRRQGQKSDKAKLNREWQQISQILQKRKTKELNDATKRMKTD